MPFQVQHQIDLPAGKLMRAKLQDLSTREVPYTDKKTGEQTSFTKLNWIFEITEQGDFFGKTVRAETSAFLSDSPHNVFNNWAKALLQRDLMQGQVLSESDLIGLPCEITVKYEEDRRDSSKKWARVADVYKLEENDLFASQPPF